MLICIATSNPPYISKQEKILDELKRRTIDNPSAIRLINSVSQNSEIDKRHFVVSDAAENNDNIFYSKNGDFINPGTRKRLDEYKHWAKTLSKNAVQKLLDKNNIVPNSINRLITVSCTGFFAPGLDYHLINSLGLNTNIKKTNIGFMGCAASVNAINCVKEVLNSSDGNKSNILLISLELCSLHLHTEPTIDNIISNTIFADGCAAAFFSNSPEYKNNIKFNIINTHSVLFEKSEDMMGWEIGDFGFDMKLSHKLPKLILSKAVPELIKILNKENISIGDIKHWVIHPGGKAILDSVQSGLNLSDEDLQPSRNILRNYGNMSSATILFILKEIIETRKINKNELCCIAAFGPGLVMEIALLKGN
ncbi:MAG: hypothetical protein COW08_04505 [Ignavibacteriales bacterium CG12_big_fil_rev_8_21_14_0_65_30_8]|nr:MAG: hypothetical protein COW08_04505 [Ignavibacteriales bacterium CG12_big_fil_rev_8_21_14_0_65_30_8]